MKKYSKKPAEIQTEIRADREEWIELLGANPSVDVLMSTGIGQSTWQAIAAGQSPLVPIAAYRLASFRRYGHLADLLGAPWRDFYVSGNTLTLPGVRNALDASALRSVWVDLQELASLRREVSVLRSTADYVDISPAVSEWLHRLGRRPFTPKIFLLDLK